MPEVVQTYIDTKDFIQVRKTQHNIVYSYQVDFSKHAPYETCLLYTSDAADE